ncbi:sugar ABC transporter permease [soil metagenome]
MRRFVIGLLFVLPTFILLGYFMYYPAYTAFVGSFTSWDGFNPPEWVGLDNFTQMWNDPVLAKAARNNLVWAIAKIALSLGPSFIVAELIFHVRHRRLQYVYRTLFVIPIIIPSVVTILMWTFYYRSDGLVNQFLGALGLDSLQHAWLADNNTALGALIFVGFPWILPFNLLVFYAGLQAIPGEIREAASLDGASTLRRIVSLDIPLVKPQFILLLTLSIIGSMQAIMEPLIMTGGGPNNATILPILYMYREGITYGNFGYSMAISLVVFVVVLALSVLSNRFGRSSTERS